MEENEMGSKEVRIRALTSLYYSNKKIQEALVAFAKGREVIPRYYEGFGKRPDTLHYPSDVNSLVQKGATSFHCSLEIWKDPLQINSDMTRGQFDSIRQSWDLLIDIDTPYLDLSKLAAQLVIKALEFHGIYNYGIKFSGSKGFHIIVSGSAFPEEYRGKKMRESYPEWPHSITDYLFHWIEPIFRKEAGKIMSFGKEQTVIMRCMQCERAAKKGVLVSYICPICDLHLIRKDAKLTKRKLRCLNEKCSGVLEVIDEKPYYYCENCKNPEHNNQQLGSDKYPEFFEEKRGEDVGKQAKFDLVLVASRHLFRMPYSLHEKTALASVVLSKEELEGFSPRDANPLKVQIQEFIKEARAGEAKKLLSDALEWKQKQTAEEEKNSIKSYGNYKTDININPGDISDSYFPEPIKKLLLGVKDGRKRGLFILLTFFKSLNMPADDIQKRVREWNKKNEQPLKEGYVKAQIDWHLKQKKKILPPNYSNAGFYKDLGLLDEEPKTKNPLVDVIRSMRKARG